MNLGRPAFSGPVDVCLALSPGSVALWISRRRAVRAFGDARWTFLVAFRIPEPAAPAVRRGAPSSQAFVPLLAEARALRKATRHAHLVGRGVPLTLALVLTVALGIVGAPLLVWLLASGRSATDAAVLMTRWMFPTSASCRWWRCRPACSTPGSRFAVPASRRVLLNLRDRRRLVGWCRGFAPIHGRCTRWRWA